MLNFSRTDVWLLSVCVSWKWMQQNNICESSQYSSHVWPEWVVQRSLVTLSWRKRSSAEFCYNIFLHFYGILWKWWTKLECRSTTNHQAGIANYLYPLGPLSNEDSSFISFTFHLPVPFSVSAHPIITSHYPPSFQSSSHSGWHLGL